MKPAPFKYYAPKTVAETVALLGRLGEDARILAGGQSLVPLMNFRLAQPTHVVDINPVSELDFIREEKSHVVIGARTRMSTLEKSSMLASLAPLIVEAVGLVAHPPIRHRGTIGGSLAHGDPASELPAATLAVDAEFVAVGSKGRRRIPAAEFFEGPFTTALRQGELLAEIHIPRWPSGTGAAFLEFSRRHGDFAIVGVAAQVHVVDGRIARIALALCGVAGTPVRARQAEATLMGAEPTEAAIATVADVAAADLEPTTDIHGTREYRRALARVYIERALALALQRVKAAA